MEHSGNHFPAAGEKKPASYPGSEFRLLRYVVALSLPVVLVAAAASVYFELQEGRFFIKVQDEQNASFAQNQDLLARQSTDAARELLLRVHEAGSMNLARVLTNLLWEEHFAPLIRRARRVSINECRKIQGESAALSERRKSCFGGVGARILGTTDRAALDARVLEVLKRSNVFKLKLYDLRGITLYSSERRQIGEDKAGNLGWRRAAAGEIASELTHSDQFSAFEGVVENRDLVSSYVPVRVGPDSPVVGVFEIYTDATPTLARLGIATDRIRATAALGRAQVERVAVEQRQEASRSGQLQIAIVLLQAALIYGALLLVVNSGQRIIRQRDSERLEAERRVRGMYESLEQRVTERTRALTAANEELERFSYTISHDLRAPLRAMASFATLLKKELGADRPARADDYLGRIERNAVRMGELIDDLLAYSRVRRGALGLRQTDMSALVAEVLESLAGEQTEGTKIELAELPQANCDPLLMRQVWLNLIDNALKFSGNAKHPRIEIGGASDNGVLEYWVKDNGMGYNPAYAAKLWGVFERLHTAAEAPPGTGIGLAIVKRIIERHGGTLRAESALGKGATFGFTLPLS